jgi:hypothetical protein
VSRPRPVVVQLAHSSPSAPATEQPAETSAESATIVEAEPFSATWNEPEQPDDEVRREAWVDADTCPAPERHEATTPYSEFVDRALGISHTRGQFASIRISPSFSAEYTISLSKRGDGAYVVRLLRLKTSVWDQMMDEMHVLQGDSIQLDDASQRAALARVVPDTELRERVIDASTARLWISLWRALLARTQVVKAIGTIGTMKSDGTLYRLSLGGRVGTTHSPDRPGVLQEVTSAVEHIERVITGKSPDETIDLDVARNLMQSALERTRKQESCWRRIEIE